MRSGLGKKQTTAKVVSGDDRRRSGRLRHSSVLRLRHSSALRLRHRRWSVAHCNWARIAVAHYSPAPTGAGRCSWARIGVARCNSGPIRAAERYNSERIAAAGCKWAPIGVARYNWARIGAARRNVGRLRCCRRRCRDVRRCWARRSAAMSRRPGFVRRGKAIPMAACFAATDFDVRPMRRRLRCAASLIVRPRLGQRSGRSRGRWRRFARGARLAASQSYGLAWRRRRPCRAPQPRRGTIASRPCAARPPVADAGRSAWRLPNAG